MIRYKTNLAGANVMRLKRELFDTLAVYESPIKEEDNVESIIYHGVKVKRVGEEYYVKTYNSKEQYVELSNVFILQLLLNSIAEEIQLVPDRQPMIKEAV